jgi:hypothetical protein
MYMSTSVDVEVESESWEETFNLILESVPATAEGVVSLCDRIESIESTSAWGGVGFRANLVLRLKRHVLYVLMCLCAYVLMCLCGDVCAVCAY